MKIEEFNEKMNENLKELDIELSEKQLKQFYDYMNILIEWNKVMNLTNIIEPEEVIKKHFIDSLTVLKHIKEDDSIIDVGTGAGFPGIPIKIAYPKTKITLLDSLNKRIKFLDEVINKLELKDIKTIHGRAEEFAHNNNYRENYNIAIARAVASLNGVEEKLLKLKNSFENGKILKEGIKTAIIGKPNVGMGLIASMGLLIFTAGHKGTRTLCKGTEVMAHQFWVAMEGKQHELVAAHAAQVRLERQFIDHYLRHSKMSEKQIKDILFGPTDRYLTPAECVKYGLADLVTETHDAPQTKRQRRVKEATPVPKIEIIEEPKVKLKRAAKAPSKVQQSPSK
jgi:16S rRNA (guanine(527)-N(7))-methyltransferase RsmG